MASTAGQILSYGARQGTLREYETVMILRPQVNKTDIMALVKRLQGVLEGSSAQLIKIDSWGMRIMSFPISHCTKGIYLYWRYLGGSDAVGELERNLRNIETVIRHYSIRIADDVDPDARPSEVTDNLLDQVSEPGPDPEEVKRLAEEEAARLRAEAREKSAAEAAARAEAEAAEAGHAGPADDAQPETTKEEG